MSVKDPFEIISSEDLLARISKFNRNIERKKEEDPTYNWRNSYMLLGTDVVSLFPSLSPEKTGRAVRLKAEKSEIEWEEIEYEWLALYIHLNKEICSNHEEIEHLLPKRRRGRKGREAGMGSEECSKRYLLDSEESNWEWPQIQVTPAIIKKLMGAALEVAVRFFFCNFTYMSGEKLSSKYLGGQ